MYLTRHRTQAASLAAVMASLFGLLVLGAVPASGAAKPTLPTDASRHGYVGLCDEKGDNVSGGSVHAKPFVWKAVGSSRPPAQFQGRGQNAVLAIYQVQSALPAANWSGNALTAATFYRNAAAPTAQATYADGSLAAFLRAFPPADGGLYELRMTFGKAGYGLYGTSYPATFLQVSGDRWHVVDGGTVRCSAGQGVSNEQLTKVAGSRLTTPRTPPASIETVRAATPPGPYHQALLAAGSPADAPSVSSGGTATATWLPALVGALCVLLGGGALYRRWRHSGSPPSQSSA